MKREGYIWEAIEAWLSDRIKGLDDDPQYACWLLLTGTCIEIYFDSNRYSNSESWKADLAVRHSINGLERALLTLLPNVNTDTSEELFLSRRERRKVTHSQELIKILRHYSMAKEARELSSLGFFSVELPSPEYVKYLPGGPNLGDFGLRNISQLLLQRELFDIHIDEKWQSKPNELEIPEWYRLRKIFSCPSWLHVGDISGDEFLSAWCRLYDVYWHKWGDKESLFTTKATLLGHICRDGAITSSRGQQILDLLTFDPAKTNSKLVFSPLVRATEKQYFVVAPLFLFGDPILSLMKSAAKLRSLPFGEMGKLYQTELEKQFRQNDVVILNDKFKYVREGKNRSIDLVVYEELTNRILIAQVKSFIPPVTVSEIYSADKRLEKAMDQLNEDRLYLTRGHWDQLGAKLGIQAKDWEPASILPAVVGNGFAGSDRFIRKFGHLGWAVVDGSYLLNPQFKGSSMIDIAASYSERLQQKAYQALNSFGFFKDPFGSFTVEFPYWNLDPSGENGTKSANELRC